MNVQILQPPDGARLAAGFTVVIDVFRAFSTACYLAANGVERIIPVDSIALGQKLIQDNPTFVLIGEQYGSKIADAAYSNSPSEIEHVDFTGRVVVFSTSAGTKGFNAASSAVTEMVAGSLVNAKAIARRIQHYQPTHVSLVCMGYRNEKQTDEDTLCAEYIRSILLGAPMDNRVVQEKLVLANGAAKFFDEQIKWAPERDFHLCAKLNRFDFVLVLDRAPGEVPALKRVESLS